MSQRHDSGPHTISTGTRPLAFLITIRAYATRLHGDANGSVDKEHNVFGEPMLSPNASLKRWEASKLRSTSCTFDAGRRQVVRTTIEQTARLRGWNLYAVNVRSNHVHFVLTAQEPPERVMNIVKSWCTRRLREAALVASDERVWVRHGSTRYLWKPAQIDAACEYVCEHQGEDLL